MRRRQTFALAVALGVILFCFADVLFLGKSLYVRDFARVYVPERAVLRTILRTGDLPLWNPFFSAGQPVAANPEYEALYPPQWLCLLPDLLTGIHLEIVLHLLFGAVGMAFLLTTLGAPRTAPFGALSFALGGVMLSATNLLPILFALTWFPWAAASLHRYLDAPTPRRFALFALTLGAIFAIGEPSTILQAVALAGAYAIWRRRARGAALAIAAGAAALLVGAVQLVPALDHQRASGRAAALPYDAVTKWSLSPARPLELLLPEAFPGADDPTGLPWMFNWSLGLVASALLIAAFARRSRGWAFVAGVAAVSYLVALGRHGPLFPLLYRAGLSFIRYPEKWFIAGWFALLIFAALAAERFLDDARFRRATFYAAIALTLGAALTRDLRTTLAALALTLILALRERTRACVALLALFTVADLASRVTVIAPRIDRAYYDEPPLARELPAPRSAVRIYNDAEWRLLASGGGGGFRLNRDLMLPQLQALWGFGSTLELDVTRTNLQPSIDFNRLFWQAQLARRDDRVPLLLRWAGATHVIELPPRVVRLPGNERYWFADQLVAGDPEQILFSQQPLTSHAALIDGPAFVPAPARVVRVAERANAVDLDVEAAGTAALVLSITPHKYWRATIDGEPAPLRIANVGFQALVVPAGQHRVAMRYRNPLVVGCGVVSLVSALTLAAVALRSRGLPPPSPR
jgi:hypothetical protein